MADTASVVAVQRCLSGSQGCQDPDAVQYGKPEFKTSTVLDHDAVLPVSLGINSNSRSRISPQGDGFESTQYEGLAFQKAPRHTLWPPWEFQESISVSHGLYVIDPSLLRTTSAGVNTIPDSLSRATLLRLKCRPLSSILVPSEALCVILKMFFPQGLLPGRMSLASILRGSPFSLQIS